jgi:hypothetical protein
LVQERKSGGSDTRSGSGWRTLAVGLALACIVEGGVIVWLVGRDPVLRAPAAGVVAEVVAGGEANGPLPLNVQEASGDAPVQPGCVDAGKSLALEDFAAALTHESMGGRMVGTPGETAAADCIAAWFDALEIPPPSRAGRRQPFTFSWEDAQYTSAGNVLAFHDVGAEWTVVVGAHYDHLGLGGSMSRAYFEEAIHPGADDNASGVAVLLDVARAYTKGGRNAKVNLFFVAFSGEEEGLFGAKAFVESAVFRRQKVLAFLNFDMVGRLHPEIRVVDIDGAMGFEPFASIVQDLRRVDVELRPSESSSSETTDRIAFVRAGIPSLSLSTGMHDDYHRPTDTVDRLNFDGMRAISALSADLIDAVSSRADVVHSAAVQGRPARPGELPSSSSEVP